MATRKPKQPQPAAESEAYPIPVLKGLESKIKLVAVADCELSALNPRLMDSHNVDDLLHSIARDGILHPPTARASGKKYEIGPGRRRFLAAQKLGMKAIQVNVVNATDEEWIDIMLDENLCRAQMHPLDVCASLNALAAKGRSKNEMAREFGQDLKWVSRHLRLNNLSPKCRTLFADGKMDLKQAIALSEGDHTFQDSIIDDKWNMPGGYLNMPASEIVDELNSNVNDLKHAPFDTKKEGLEGIQSCLTCAKRTKNDATLFSSEMLDGDKCLDSSCWKLKTKASYPERVEKLKKSLNPVAVIENFYSERTAPKGGHSAKPGWKKIEGSKCDSIALCTPGHPADLEDGDIYLYCTNANCKIHKRSSWEMPGSGSKAAAPIDETPLQAEQRKLEGAQERMLKKAIFEAAKRSMKLAFEDEPLAGWAILKPSVFREMIHLLSRDDGKALMHVVGHLWKLFGEPTLTDAERAKAVRDKQASGMMTSWYDDADFLAHDIKEKSGWQARFFNEVNERQKWFMEAWSLSRCYNQLLVSHKPNPKEFSGILKEHWKVDFSMQLSIVKDELGVKLKKRAEALKEKLALDKAITDLVFPILDKKPDEATGSIEDIAAVTVVLTGRKSSHDAESIKTAKKALGVRGADEKLYTFLDSLKKRHAKEAKAKAAEQKSAAKAKEAKEAKTAPGHDEEE